MKHIPKSADEPEGLTGYRSKNPDATWEQFRDETQSAHEDVVPNFDQRVEHFHPKSDSSAECRCGEYIYHATRILFKWLNRKSQRNSYTWEGYRQVLLRLNWPMNGVRKDLCPCRGEEGRQAF